MKLSDYQDANGIALQTFVDSLIEKIAAHTTLTGFIVIVDLEKAKKTNEGIHLISCLGEGATPGAEAAILAEIARQMKHQKPALEGYNALHAKEN